MEKIKKIFKGLDFKTKWTNEFNSHYDGIVRLMRMHFSTVKETELSVEESKNHTDYEMKKAMTEVLDYVFAIAKSANIKASVLAKNIRDKKALHLYSSMLIREIVALNEKVIEAEQKAMKKSKAKSKA